MKKLILILAVVLPFWANAQDYRVIDWKTDVLNIQTVGIDTFKFDAEPKDYNDAGAITREIGNYFIDFVARCFKIIDSNATTITVVDLEHINLAPQSNKIGRVYQSIVDADSLFESIGGVDISVLDDLSKWKDVARNNEIFGRKIKEKKLVDLSDVNDSTPKLTKTGQTLIWDEDSGYFDFNYNPLSIHEITHEPTGFEYPESVIVNYNSTNRTVTLTGNTTAFWRGDTISALVSGWTSTAHTATAGIWYLYYNGTNFIWSQSPWTFDMVQIAFVNYNFFAIKETHGLMQYQTHKELHETIGTYVSAGGDLSDYVVNSTTAADRRPLISQTTVMDEDNGTVMPALSSETYTRFYLTSIDSAKFTASSADIVSLSTNQPYWNQLSGDNWQQTLMANNSYSAAWVVGIPVASDAQSQPYRYLFVQPQSNSSTLSTIQAQSASSVSLGKLTGLTPELVFFAKIIIQYTAANWKIVSVEKLIGNKINQQAIIGGSYLSTVTTDTTLTGNGTTSNPLKVDTTEIATAHQLSLKVPFSGADRDVDLGANSINADTFKLDNSPLLLNTFKQGNLGGASNIFYSTGASSQPASGSINQVIGGNSLTANYVPKWDGSKLANSGMSEVGGNFGIGSNATNSKLTIANSVGFGIEIDPVSIPSVGRIFVYDRSISQFKDMRFGSTTNPITFTSIGKVGINKTIPAEQLDVNGNLIADVLKSRVPTGTPPLVVASSTKVDSLNVGFLDGKKASDFQLKSDTLTFDATLSDLNDSTAAIRALANTKAVVSGTDNYIMKKTGANTLGNSLARSNNTGIGIGVDANRTLHIGASGQPTFAFSDTRGGIDQQEMGFLYDAGISLSRPGMVFQKLGNDGSFSRNLFTFFQNGTINFDGIDYPDSNSVVFGTKKIGLGTPTPAARIHSQSTTTQLRLGYDATKYTDLSTGSTGNLTIDPTGDTTKVVGAVNSTGGFFKNGIEITGGGGSMVYPSAGLAKSTGTGWATSITDNSSNWNNAYDKKITTVGFTGTGATKQLKINRQDGTYIESYFTDLGGEWSMDTYGMTYIGGSVGVGTASISGTWFKGGDGTGTKIGLHGASYSGTGVYGTSASAAGVKGISVSNDGVYGTSSNRYGVNGASTNSYGVYGASTNSYGGVFEGLGCKATKFYVSSLNTAPASSSATGTTGEIRFTSDYIYVCVATNTWKRTQISTW